ncbi:MAG: pilus assembly protein PilM [Calditrichaeota bacterium]|nr:pilus assembly protein PilM [Calditrichota bacterium]
MAMDNDDILLGLNVFGKKLRMVEARKRDGETQLQNVGEADLEAPFDFYAVGNRDLIPKFAEEINNLIQESGLHAKSVNFAIERRMVLIKRLTVDSSLSEAELHQHVEWELEQLLVAARGEYNVGFETAAMTKSGYKNIVVVAVRKAIISYLQEVFAKTFVELSSIDVDLFSAIRGLCGNSLDSHCGLCALVDFNERGLDFTIINNGEYITSGEIPAFRAEGSGGNLFEAPGEDVADLVNEEITRLLNTVQDSSLFSNLEKIYLAGDKADSALIPHLQALQQNTEIQFADPFKNVGWNPLEDPPILIKESAEKFLAAVGMTLI